MNYDEATRSTRAVALALGIPGHSAEANARRAGRALEMEAERTQRVAVAHERRAPWEEIEVPSPFGVKLVAAAGGDLSRVVPSTEFARALEADMGLDSTSRYRPDVRGVWREDLAPSAGYLEAVTDAVTFETNRIRVALHESGALGPDAERLVAISEIEGQLSTLEYEAGMLDSMADTMDEPEYYLQQAEDRWAKIQQLEDRYGPELEAAHAARRAGQRADQLVAPPSQAARTSHDVAASAARDGSSASHAAALSAAGQSTTSEIQPGVGRATSHTPGVAKQMMSKIRSGLGLERS